MHEKDFDFQRAPLENPIELDGSQTEIDPLRFTDEPSPMDRKFVPENDRLGQSAQVFTESIGQSPTAPGIQAPAAPVLFFDEVKRSSWLGHLYGRGNQTIAAIGVVILLAMVLGRMEFQPAPVAISEPISAAPPAAHPVALSSAPTERTADHIATTKISEANAVTPVLVDDDRKASAPGADTPEKRGGSEPNGAKDQRPARVHYQISGASFLRNKPAANAEIIATLRPGTRIAVTDKTGDYFRVRSLGDEKISGFVHREDAFFERLR